MSRNLQTEQARRRALLTQCGNDPGQLAATDVDFDFATDSWAQLSKTHISERREELSRRARLYEQDLTANAAQLFPFRHFLFTQRGRDAEALLFQALNRENLHVPQNILFYTARDHQKRLGMQPHEIPVPDAFQDGNYPFWGNIDLHALEELLRRGQVGVVYIELLSNGIGGFPVSLANLQASYELTRHYGVPLYLDATRSMENALYNLEHEAACFDRDLRQCWLRLFEHCDGITLSLAKNYGVASGGLLATHSTSLFKATKEQARQILPEEDSQALAQALADWSFMETAARKRHEQVQRLGRAMQISGFPVRLPVGGHALMLDPNLATARQEPREFLSVLFIRYGLRCSLHSGGLSSRFSNWVRLAIPAGTPDEELEHLMARFSADPWEARAHADQALPKTRGDGNL